MFLRKQRRAFCEKHDVSLQRAEILRLFLGLAPDTQRLAIQLLRELTGGSRPNA
jgi:hypothetical protein